MIWKPLYMNQRKGKKDTGLKLNTYLRGRGAAHHKHLAVNQAHAFLLCLQFLNYIVHTSSSGLAWREEGKGCQAKDEE